MTRNVAVQTISHPRQYLIFRNQGCHRLGKTHSHYLLCDLSSQRSELSGFKLGQDIVFRSINTNRQIIAMERKRSCHRGFGWREGETQDLLQEVRLETTVVTLSRSHGARTEAGLCCKKVSRGRRWSADTFACSAFCKSSQDVPHSSRT